MNLIEKWKNRETINKLKKENIRLKEVLVANAKSLSNMITVESNIQRVRFSVLIDNRDLERGLPAEHIKRDIANGIIEQITPFIELDFFDAPKGDGKIYTGTVYVATGDRKNEWEQ